MKMQKLATAVWSKQYGKAKAYTIIGTASLGAFTIGLNAPDDATVTAKPSSSATQEVDPTLAEYTKWLAYLEAEKNKPKPTTPPPAPAKPSVPATVAGLNESQTKHAVNVVKAGKDTGFGADGIVIGLMTAYQESKLINYGNPGVSGNGQEKAEAQGFDHDSTGIMQQRAALGWCGGSVACTMDSYQTSAHFFKALAQVPGWGSMGKTYAAQAVQHSAFPEAYAQWEGLAWNIYNGLKASI